MVADAIKLMLFPALMAFAASSDLLTMTISNRVSLILAGGFFALALFARHERHGDFVAPRRRRRRSPPRFRTLCPRLDRRRRREARGVPQRYGSASIIFCPTSSTPRFSAAH